MGFMSDDYVVETNQHREKLATAELKQKGYPVWFPQAWSTVCLHGLRQPVIVPLFLRFIFVTVKLTDQDWRIINGTKGVKRMLQLGPRPLPMPAKEIGELRRRVGDKIMDQEKLYEAMRPLLPDDHVAVTDGPFTAFNGFVVSTAKGRAEILLSIFGRQTKVELAETQLRRIDA